MSNYLSKLLENVLISYAISLLKCLSNFSESCVSIGIDDYNNLKISPILLSRLSAFLQ